MHNKTITLLFLCCLLVSLNSRSIAQRSVVSNKLAVQEEIVIKEHPQDTNAIFKSNTLIRYQIDLKSTFNNTQRGKLAYAITDLNGRLVTRNAVPVVLEPKGSKQVQLDMPAQRTGFYKVNFMLNTGDYDDTVRRVFGVDIYKIRSDYAKPADFDAFWSNTKAELAKVPPNFKVTEKPELEKGNDQVFLVEMLSLDNVTIRGWLTLPKDRNPKEKLAVYLVLPGYGANLQPQPNIPNFACLSINVRGLGNSRDMISPGKEEYISYRIEDKYRYIYRGAIMDGLRALDFISGRADMDVKSIYVTGGSMGGYLTLALAALDSRVAYCAADNPSFADMRSTVLASHFPMSSIQYYAKRRSLPMSMILNNLDYFDLKNFAPAIKSKTIIAMGLLDEFAPPNTELVLYNSIPDTRDDNAPNKQLFIYPNLGHEIGNDLGNIKGKWIYDGFHIYDKVMASRVVSKSAVSVKSEPKPQETGETINITEHPANKEAIFKPNETVSYAVDLKSSYNTMQVGTLSYNITTPGGNIVFKSAMPLSLKPSAAKHVDIDIPAQPSGFYNINFMVNVTDHDDTVRRVFGVDISKIFSQYPKPDDFDVFWANTRKELNSVAPDFKLIRKADLDKGNDEVYLVEMRSLDNVLVRGWLVLPKDRRTKIRLPVYIALPGYGADMKPMYDASPDMARLSLNLRGQGNSKDDVKITREEVISYHIEDKNKYILRGGIMDCVRMVDLIFSRPDIFDTKAIYASGGSMGGYLALVLASLDPRITLCSAGNPSFADFRSLASRTDFPMGSIKAYTRAHKLNFDEVLNNLDYFDLKNFVSGLKCKTLIGIGLLDPIAPPTGSVSVYNNITAGKKLFIYPELGHEVGDQFSKYAGKWLFDNLGIF